ncbi:MAG: hypothetical protein PT120_03345 [Aphanizomenon gracile PMC649.10]|nr:hypothetical protein [Aphanizomenon gracile PMC649.10]
MTGEVFSYLSPQILSLISGKMLRFGGYSPQKRLQLFSFYQPQTL